MSEHPNYEEYWKYPTFSALGMEQGYIIEPEIVTAENLLIRFSGFEPFELALAINNSILFHMLDKPYDFPRPFLLCKTRQDCVNNRLLYFLLSADSLFPFQYTWENDKLNFDFTGIVFKENTIKNIEYCAVDTDFLLRHAEAAPQPYQRLSFLKQNFPADGHENIIASLMRQISAEQKSMENREISANKKDMSKANERRRSNVETRWKNQFLSGIAAAVFCLQQYQQTGIPVTRKEYAAALREQGHEPLMVEADSLFRKLMPQEEIHRGD